MEAFREMWSFMRIRKKFWLAPIVIVLMLLGALFFIAQSSTVLSPFIYVGI